MNEWMNEDFIEEKKKQKNYKTKKIIKKRRKEEKKKKEDADPEVDISINLLLAFSKGLFWNFNKCALSPPHGDWRKLASNL